MNWIFVPFDDRSFSGWSCLAIYPGTRTWSNSPCGLWSVFISNDDKDVFKRDPFSIDCQGNVNRTPRVRMQITDKVCSWVEFITSAFDGFYTCTWTPSSLCILSSLLSCEHHTSLINTKTQTYFIQNIFWSHLETAHSSILQGKRCGSGFVALLCETEWRDTIMLKIS